MFSPGIEPGTFCVLDRCDNRYTTKTLGSEKHVRSMYFRVFWGGADFCPLNTQGSSSELPQCFAAVLHKSARVA